MDNKNSINEILCSAVKKAICEDYDCMDFYDHVYRAILAVIEEGYVFEDYLYFANEIHYGFEMNHTSDEWKKILKRAYKNRGLDYEILLKEQQELNSQIAKELQEAMESKDIVANVTMGDFIEKALTKLNRQELSDDID